MCGRFTLTDREIDLVARRLGAEVDRERARLYRPRWNVAPTNMHWVALVEDGRRRLVPARFGLGGRGGRLVINARAETAAKLRAFRTPYREGRCVVPADGFYEWPGGRGERRPVWFHAAAGALMGFAGLAVPAGDALAFVILTTAANAIVRPLHDRMPVLLSASTVEPWLSRGDASVLAPAPDGWLAAREVSPLVNSPANDGPELLEAAPPGRQLELV